MNDEDFEQFITLLDAAIASDDPKIQKALKKFVFLIRLNLSDEDCKPGPFTKMMETIDDLQRRVGAVEAKDATWTQQPYYGGGTSIGTDPNTHWYNGGSGTAGNITFTNATSNVTIPSTTTTTAGNITLSGVASGSTCTGFTASAVSGNTTTTAIFPAYEVDSGSKIKDQIKEKLTKLAKVA